MAATGACFVAGGFLPVFGRGMKSAGGLRTNLVSVRSSAVLTDLDKAAMERRSLKDYFEQSKELIRSDGGPPRWFSLLECGSPSDSSPLLLFLPGFYIICSFFSCSKYFVGNTVLFLSVL